MDHGAKNIFEARDPKLFDPTCRSIAGCRNDYEATMKKKLSRRANENITSRYM